MILEAVEQKICCKQTQGERTPFVCMYATAQDKDRRTVGDQSSVQNKSINHPDHSSPSPYKIVI